MCAPVHERQCASNIYTRSVHTSDEAQREKFTTTSAEVPVAGPAAKAGLLFAALMVTLPFLNPVHTFPIPGFYESALAIGLGLLAIACVTKSNGNSNPGIPKIALWSAALAGYLFFQSTWPTVSYAEPAQLAGLHLLWAAALMCAGFQLCAILGSERVANTLATAILIGALANAGMGWIQMLDMTDFYGGWGEHPRHIVSGFIFQPNLHANYLVVGVACLAYLWNAKIISLWSSLISGLLLASGIELAASRASVLMLGWLFMFALWYAIKARGLSMRRGLMVGVIALILLGTFAAGTHILVPRTGVFERVYGMVSSGEGTAARIGMYKAAVATWLSAPFFGVGIDGFAWSHFQHAKEWFEGDSITVNAHNILLHFLAESGLIGALILVLGVAFWLARSLSDLAHNPLLPKALAIAIVGVEFAHSTVEFPLWNAEYLGLAALMMGMSDPKKKQLSSAKAYIAMTVAVVVFGGALLALTIRDYVDRRALQHAVSSKAPGDLQVQADKQRIARRMEHSILHPYFDLSMAFSIQLTSEDLERKINFTERVMHFWPSRWLIQNQIVLLALAGREQESLALLEHLAKLQPWTNNDLRNTLDGIPFTEMPEDSPLRLRVEALAPRAKR